MSTDLFWSQTGLTPSKAHPASYPSSEILANLTTANAEQKLLSNRVNYPTVQKRLLDMGITYFSFAMERTPLDQEIGFGRYSKMSPLSTANINRRLSLIWYTPPCLTR
jgi:hypothetical protein